jgi:hypothetical protein
MLNKKTHVLVWGENTNRILTNPDPEEIPEGSVVGVVLPDGIPPHYIKPTASGKIAVMTASEAAARDADIRERGAKFIPDPRPATPSKEVDPKYDPSKEPPPGKAEAPAPAEPTDTPTITDAEEDPGILGTTGRKIAAGGLAAAAAAASYFLA